MRGRAVLKGRSKAPLEAFFDTMPAPLVESITRVCVDMNEGYISAVKAKAPGAEIIVDRFHVARQCREAAAAVRESELKPLKKELRRRGVREAERSDVAVPQEAARISSPKSRRRPTACSRSRRSRGRSTSCGRT